MQTHREYAEALFMLAVEENSVEEYTSALALVDSLVKENPEYIEFLASPAFSLDERVQAIDEAFGAAVPENVVSFLKILCESSRIRSLEDCIEEFKKLIMALSETSVATVYSAIPLSEEQKQGICAKLSKITGKSIEATYIIDKSLIGGLKIDVDGKTFDGSIKHRLNEVKDVIIG